MEGEQDYSLLFTSSLKSNVCLRSEYQTSGMYSKNLFRKYFLKTFKMENLTVEVRQMMSKVVCGSTNWQKMCRVRCQCYVGWRCLVEKLQSSQQPTSVPLHNRTAGLLLLSQSFEWTFNVNIGIQGRHLVKQYEFGLYLLRLFRKRSNYPALRGSMLGVNWWDWDDQLKI